MDNNDEWLNEAKDAVQKACHAKFSQDDYAKKTLKDTLGDHLAEASMDKIWGIGLTLRDKDLGDKSKWTGRNTLGSILMHIRDNVLT